MMKSSFLEKDEVEEEFSSLNQSKKRVQILKPEGYRRAMGFSITIEEEDKKKIDHQERQEERLLTIKVFLNPT